MQVSSRPSQGETPLRPQLALLAANMARVQARSVVLDPFVGSGSLLLGAAHIGAHCFGSDRRYMVQAVMSVGPCQLDIFSLPRRAGVRKYLRSPLRTCGQGIHRTLADAIITDPPYGMRKRAAAHSRGRKHDEAGMMLIRVRNYMLQCVIAPVLD